VAFKATDETGFPVYHTNVMMAIGTDVAVVCADSVEDATERRHLLQRLRRHHEVRRYHIVRRGGWCMRHWMRCCGSGAGGMHSSCTDDPRVL
jgi:N,N dimethylarginine dimethylhydrolase, eukaryotic